MVPFHPLHEPHSCALAASLTGNGYNYNAVTRWTNRPTKVDIFTYSKVIIPINHGNSHWTLAAIDMLRRRIVHYDSLYGYGARARVCSTLLQYLQDEHRTKRGTEMDTTGWVLTDELSGCPKQNNGVDCGVFTSLFADFVSEDVPLSFGQGNILDFRKRMVVSILRKALPS